MASPRSAGLRLVSVRRYLARIAPSGIISLEALMWLCKQSRERVDARFG
jgi:hypothetical protein